VQQPWAWLIVNGHRDLENRSWWTKQRGPIAIYAPLDFDAAGYAWVRGAFPGIEMPDPEQFDTGGIVGAAELVDCVKSHDSRWFSGPFAFVLKHAEVCQSIPCSDGVAIFEWKQHQLKP